VQWWHWSMLQHIICVATLSLHQNFISFYDFVWSNKKPCAVQPVSCTGDILWRQALLKSCGCGIAPQEKEACHNSIHGVWAWDVIGKTISQYYEGINLCCDQCCYGVQPEWWSCYARSQMPIAGIGYTYGMAILESRQLQLSLRWLKRPLRRQNWSSNHLLLPKSIMLWPQRP